MEEGREFQIVGAALQN